MRELLAELLRLESAGIPAVLVTVIGKEGHSPAPLQGKMLLGEGRQWGTVGGGALERLAQREAEAVLAAKVPRVVPYRLSTDMEIIEGQPTGMVCGGTVTLLYEYYGPAERVVLFGAGHIGQALARLLLDAGFGVTVVDARPEMLALLDPRCRREEADAAAWPEANAVPEGSYAVISTHSHELDYRVLRAVYEAAWPLAYLGMIASHAKREVLFGRLPEALQKTADMEKLYTPCGLDIGGRSPAEIALSVAAEIQSVRYGRGGHRHMRER